MSWSGIASTHLENQINDSKKVSVALGDWEGAHKVEVQDIKSPVRKRKILDMLCQRKRLLASQSVALDP